MAWSHLQEKIFSHINHPNNLGIIARAGSGKTTTIVEIVKRIPQPNKILLCAFNVDIRDELKDRVPKYCDVKTLNGLGFGGVIRLWGNGLTINENRQLDIVTKIIGDKYPFSVKNDIVKLTSLCMAYLYENKDDIVNLMYERELFPSEDFDVNEDKYVDWVQQALLESRVKSREISFDDQVYVSAYFNAPLFKYDYVLVDEAQDLNTAQKRLVANALKRDGKIIFVGDPAQAIYGFRGAESDSMDNLVSHFKADTMPLSVTYRCPKRVVKLANTIVPDFEAKPDAEEGNVRKASVSEMRDLVKPGDYVLSRYNGVLLTNCFALIRAGKKAHIAGKDIAGSLAGLIKKSNQTAIGPFLKWLALYTDNEAKKLTEAGRENKVDELYDRLVSLRELSEDCDTVHQLIGRINKLFTKSDGPSVTFSSVHKAKGLEADNVWAFEQTFRVGKNTEEDNLFYVAVTRAKKNLYLIQTPRKDGKEAHSILDSIDF